LLLVTGDGTLGAMKKLATMTIAAGVLLTALTGCVGNKDVLGTEYTFTKAQIKLQDGTVKTCDVDSWARVADSSNIRVTCKGGGGVYYTGSENVTLYNL